ncbi:hypothetical protein RP20_CCG022032 [Aedes albopictus]|nr:hypothetical protein RP20_CCG022032 [Aedes albopictus]
MDSSVEFVEDLVEDVDNPDVSMVDVIQRAEAVLASLPARRPTTNRTVNKPATGTTKERSRSTNNKPGPSRSTIRYALDDSDCIIVIPDPEELKPTVNAPAAPPPSPPAPASEAISCPICFEPVFQGPAASTICGHLYCYQCITTEIKVRPKCPMCSRPLQASEVIQLFRN